MKIEYDADKAAANLGKHGVSFGEVEPVFYDPLALSREDADAEGERRFVTVGLGALGRILTVVWTMRGDGLRLIFARPSTRNERRTYEG